RPSRASRARRACRPSSWSSIRRRSWRSPIAPSSWTTAPWCTRTAPRRCAPRPSCWTGCSASRADPAALSFSFHGGSMEVQRIGLVGYGEVGKIFASGLMPRVAGVAAWDLKFGDPATRQQEQDHARGAGVRACASMRELCEASDLVISAVTASNTLAVAEEAARFLRPGTVFLDLNSASPGTKQKAAAAVDARGAHYVEAGVMTSIPPYGIRVPMLLGGAKAEELAQLLGAW